MVNKYVIEQCKRGNARAQKKLYKTFVRKMFMHCYRYLQQKEDSEEVVSEGFIKVFANLSKVEFRDPYSFEGWIKRIMINECLMFLRKRKIKFSEYEDMQELENTHAIDNLMAEDIYRIIQSLPIGYRTVFNLYVIEGYSHKEISQKLEITEGASRSQLSRARKILQKLMGEKIE